MLTFQVCFPFNFFHQGDISSTSLAQSVKYWLYLQFHLAYALCFRSAAFIAGSFLAVLVLLTIWDFDVLEVEHLFAIGAGLTFIVHICRTLIPDEVNKASFFFFFSVIYQSLRKCLVNNQNKLANSVKMTPKKNLKWPKNYIRIRIFDQNLWVKK